MVKRFASLRAPVFLPRPHTTACLPTLPATIHKSPSVGFAKCYNFLFGLLKWVRLDQVERDLTAELEGIPELSEAVGLCWKGPSFWVGGKANRWAQFGVKSIQMSEPSNTSSEEGPEWSDFRWVAGIQSLLIKEIVVRKLNRLINEIARTVLIVDKGQDYTLSISCCCFEDVV
jgi:hypothetical protein